jgi:glycosyltransferase involved in cell wall biosynthesis
MVNKYKVFAIATDIVSRGGTEILKNGRRMCGAIGWYRIVNPLKRLGADITVGMAISARPESALELKKRGDIWFCKMTDNQDIDHIYSAHKEFTGAKFILDIDDEPGDVDEAHPDYKAILDRKEMRMRMIKMADHIVVSTPQIKESIKDINSHVTVIPNAIDPKIWKWKRKEHKDGKIRIGWMSSGSHFVDLPIIEPAMNEILDEYPNVEFHFAGMTWDETQEDRFYHHVGTKDYAKFPRWYANLGIDIAICPLKDTKFNRAKSNIKWMEASMLGIPCVVSDVEPYRCVKHGVTGYLANNTADFKKYLITLIENEEKRREIGKNAKKDVLDNWTTDKFTHLYEELFKKIADKKEIAVITSITGDKDELEDQPEYKGVEYLAFTDKKSELWNTKPACNKFVEPVMNAKIHKILSHKYTDLPYIVWMDGNCTLKQNPKKLVELMGDKDFAFFKHPSRDCVYDEADACVSYGRGNTKEMAEQIKAYAKQEFPTNNGLIEATCFVRKNNPRTNDLFEKWWADICRYSSRDQLSFPVAFKGQKWATIPGSVATIDGNKDFPGNEFFNYKQHKTL